MSVRHRVLMLVLLVSFLTSGCGSAEPTATSVPATATRIAVGPTNTPLAPTATSAPPTVTAIPPTLTDTPSLPPTATPVPPTAVPSATPTPLPPLVSLESIPQVFGYTDTPQVGLGDLDSDGDLDAVFANMGGIRSQVWLNDGTGQFIDSGQRLTQQGHGVGLGDLDGDGDLDIFMTCAHYDPGDGWRKRPSRVYLNDGGGTFQDSGQDIDDTELSGTGLKLIDLDGDGDLDAHVIYYEVGGMADRVYLNDGAGRFSDSGLALAEEGIAWGDLDGDGDVDIFAKVFEEGYRVLLNDGTGQFAADWEMENSQAMRGDIALADFDGDGDLDALVANGSSSEGSYPTRLLWNDSSGQFTDSGQELNETSAAKFDVGDLDRDGNLDVFVSNADLPNEVWLNDGNGQFTDSGLRLEGSSRSLTTRPTLGDLDGDGDLDVVVAGFRGKVEVWLNHTPTGEREGNDLYLGQMPPGLDMEIFAPGIVSVEDGKEYNITFSPDLQEIFFTRRTPGGRNDRLWYSRLENGTLTTPEPAPFAYDSLETDACFTPDGKRLYFNSWRPLPGEETPSPQHNVWFVDKTEEGWSEPQFLGPPLNDYRPVYFSIADDGTLYFTRASPREIWYAKLEDGQYLEAQSLPDEINYLKGVAHPAISPDESYIVVDSYYQQGSRLVGYLYVSFRKPDGSWTKAVSLRDALHASDADVHAMPRITPDGKYLFFEDYEKETDKADIYWVSTEVIEKMRSEVLE